MLRPPPSGVTTTGTTATRPARRLPTPLIIVGVVFLCVVITCGGGYVVLRPTIDQVLTGTPVALITDTPEAPPADTATVVVVVDATSTPLPPTPKPPPPKSPTPTRPVPVATADAATERALRDAVLAADAAQTNALKLLDDASINMLSDYYTGPALKDLIDATTSFKDRGLFMESTLIDTRDWSYGVIDATHADVIVTEVWASQVYDSRAKGMLAFYAPHDVPQVQHMEKTGGAWKVAAITFQAESPAPQTDWTYSFDNNAVNWDAKGSTGVKGGAYHLVQTDAQYGYSVRCKDCGTFASFTFEADAQQVSGEQTIGHGIVFDLDDSGERYTYYAFLIAGDGRYFFGAFKPDNTWESIVPWTNLPGNVPLESTNRLKVVAQPGSFELYLNAVKLTTISDTTYNHGKIGFYVDGKMEVVFDNVRIQLPGVP